MLTNFIVKKIFTHLFCDVQYPDLLKLAICIVEKYERPIWKGTVLQPDYTNCNAIIPLLSLSPILHEKFLFTVNQWDVSSKKD